MIKQILKKFPWQEVILISTILIVGLPSLFVSWMIVDDGYYFSVEQSFSQAASSLNISAFGNALLEPDRFRPALRFYLWLTYLIAGNNIVIHHLLNFLISGLTVVLIYFIIKNLTSSRSAGLFGGLVFTFTYFNLENWYRLMTPEPKITFFAALSVFYILICLKRLQQYGKPEKRYLVLAIMPLFFAYLIRETSFSFFPFSLMLFSGFLYFKNNPKKKTAWLKIAGIYFVFNLLLAGISLATNLMLKNQGTYTSFYELSLSKMYTTGDNYLRLIRESLSPFAQLLGISFLISWFSVFRSKNISFERFWQLIFLITGISCFMVLLPWGIPVGRYLELVIFFLSLVMGIEVSFILKNKIVKSKWYFLVFSFCFFLMFLGNAPFMYNYVRDTIVGQKNINILLKYLSINSSPKSQIFWNAKEDEGLVELIMQCNILLDKIYNRPDLKIIYLNGETINNLQTGNLIINGIIYDKDYFISEPELLKTKKEIALKIEVPHEVRRISLNIPSVKRVIHLAILGKPLLERPIYSENLYQNIWKIYQIN